MTEAIYYKEEVIPLVFRMALELFKAADGNPEEIFEKHKKMILDLLKDKQVSSEDIVIDDKFDHEWTPKVAKRFCKDLTDYQLVILKTIINSNGIAAIEELEHGIKEAGLVWTSNHTIGGALSGLSRKCLKESIPFVWDLKGDKYIITKQAEPFIKKYINQNNESQKS